MNKIRKAVFPVAGFGTRFLPATKANPKEMLPIVDKPLIQYAVEEAVEAGITELIFVTNHAKRAIEDHFDSNFELEEKLRQQGKDELVHMVQNIIPSNVTCVYVRQYEALGLGHAILCAKKIVNNEPFAVLLADDLIDGEKKSCLRQMVDEFDKQQASIVAVEQVDEADVGKYGIVGVNQPLVLSGKMNTIVEKPVFHEAPSDLGVVGRYILTPKIFECIESASLGSGGEIQLTDAIAKLLVLESVYALKFNGERFDCGSKLGYLEATIKYALKHSEVSDAFCSLLHSIVNANGFNKG